MPGSIRSQPMPPRSVEESVFDFGWIDWVTAFFKCQEHRGPDAYQRDRGLDFIKPDRPAGRRPECSDSSRAAETVG